MSGVVHFRVTDIIFFGGRPKIVMEEVDTFLYLCIIGLRGILILHLRQNHSVLLHMRHQEVTRIQ